MDLRRAAVGLQKAIGEKFGVKSRIRTGASGDLTILVDGQSVFNYKKEGSMPAMDELLRRIGAQQRAG
jgi:predicted Rdx family selenoprotein